MGIPKSEVSMPEARGFLNKCLESPNGIRARFDTKGQAIQFRQKCYTVRDRDRTRAIRLYGDGATSIWDSIGMHIKPDIHRCKVCKSQAEHWYVVAIAEADAAVDQVLDIEEL